LTLWTYDPSIFLEVPYFTIEDFLRKSPKELNKSELHNFVGELFVYCSDSLVHFLCHLKIVVSLAWIGTSEQPVTLIFNTKPFSCSLNV